MDNVFHDSELSVRDLIGDIAQDLFEKNGVIVEIDSEDENGYSALKFSNESAAVFLYGFKPLKDSSYEETHWVYQDVYWEFCDLESGNLEHVLKLGDNLQNRALLVKVVDLWRDAFIEVQKNAGYDYLLTALGKECADKYKDFCVWRPADEYYKDSESGIFVCGKQIVRFSDDRDDRDFRMLENITKEDLIKAIEAAIAEKTAERVKNIKYTSDFLPEQISELCDALLDRSAFDNKFYIVAWNEDYSAYEIQRNEDNSAQYKPDDRIREIAKNARLDPNILDDILAVELAKADGFPIIPLDELPVGLDRAYEGWIDTPANRTRLKEIAKQIRENEFVNAVLEQKDKPALVELTDMVKAILEAHDIHIVEHLDTPTPRISVIAVGRELLDLRFDEFTEENIIRAMEADVDIAIKNSNLITNDDERRAYNHLYNALDEIRDVMANRGIGTKAAAVLSTNGIEIGAIDIGNDVTTSKFRLPTLYGDDYCFEINYSSDFNGAFKKFADEFDRDKFVVEYIVANERNGVIPITVNEVIEDAQYVRDTLSRAAKNLEKNKEKQVER